MAAMRTTAARHWSTGAVLALVAFGSAADSGGAGDANACIPTGEPIQLASESASAGYWSNFTNRAGSIRAASKKMLTSALESAKSEKPASWVRFTSMPTLAKNPGEDEEMCSRHEQATRKAPLTFADKHFESVDELTSWIMDFTQGKGDDGKSLYEQCPGKCSPRYTWWIEPRANGMTVKPFVVCGLPRDREGDMYRLTTAVAPPCAAKAKP